MEANEIEGFTLFGAMLLLPLLVLLFGVIKTVSQTKPTARTPAEPIIIEGMEE